MTKNLGANQAIRDGVKQSDDPRVERTRAAIRNAVGLLSDSGVELSVASIARTAGVSRATFYSHFASLDELANSLRSNAFAFIGDLYLLDRRQSPDAMRLSQSRLVDHFAKNHSLYAAVASMRVSKERYLGDVRTMAGVIETALSGHSGLPAGLQVSATARYIAGAAYGLLDAWIASEIVLTPGELIDHLMRLLPPWFSGMR